MRSGLLRDPTMLLLTLPALLWALSFHEFCHGFAAWLVGDKTAQRAGRLTLNPLAHFDLIGTLMLLFVGFGWAKPVPIRLNYGGKHWRRDLIIVSLAGVVGNILTAIVTVLFLRWCGAWWIGLTGRAGLTVMMQMIVLNMGLAAFNLIPIPPLDGSRILEAFLPFRYRIYYDWFAQNSTVVLLLLLLTGIIDFLFNPIMRLLWLLLPVR